MMGHDNLSNHFKTNFSMVQHHKWDIGELNNMIPWERIVYVDLLQKFLEDQEKEARDREAQQKAYYNSLNRRKM